MGQMIPTSLFGTLVPDQASPVYYPLNCPECVDAALEFGKQDDLAYGSEHHGDTLDEVRVPVSCSECGKLYTLLLKPDPLSQLHACLVKRK